MQQSKDHRHHRLSNQSSPALAHHNGTNPYLNNNSRHQTPIPTPLPLSSSIQCSAYFIYRFDLDNYTEYTLKQTVDRVVSGPKTKGLKVKLSLPDEGLIIDNVLDPNQSWMYKTSELLYFWPDPYYLNIIVVITINRSRYHSTGPYSASIFRLRGNESVQLFLRRAQQFFAQLSSSNNSRNNSKISVEKSATIENRTTDNNHKKKSKHRSTSNKESISESFRSPQTTTTVNRVTRTEFDPKKTTTNSVLNLNNHRTYSETTVSSDKHTTNSKKQNNNYDEIDKLTTVSNHLSGEYVVDLMRELKELRNEIASLKLEVRLTPLRSTSTTPLTVFPENTIKERINSSLSLTNSTSQSEIDAGTQTDFSFINHEQQELSEKDTTIMDISNDISVRNKRKNEQSNTTINKRTFSSSSNNTASDQEEITLENSFQMNDSSNGLTSYAQEEYQPTSFSTRPRPILKTYQNGSTYLNGSKFSALSNNHQSISNSNSNEEDSSSRFIPVIIEKEIPKFLTTNTSSSISMDKKSLLPIKTGNIVSFRSSLENTIDPPEHIYENIPILIQMDSNKGSYHNIPIVKNENNQQQSKRYLYVSIADDSNSEIQQQYLSQLFGPQNGIALLIPQQSIENNSSSLLKENISSETQETIFNNHQYPQQVLFSDHLTNPLFNVDKQLLANTIANQFGIDLNSPYLQKLIENQHLFVPHKRTFANMIWQITPEEENILCSLPVTTSSNIIDIDTVDSNSSTVKSILKSNKSSHSISKKQHISWDSTLD